MAFPQSKGGYTSFYDGFQQCALWCAVNKNWHHIWKQWVDSLKNSQSNYFSRTNNRVKRINAKLKMVITRYSGIIQFFNNLMQCLSSLWMGWDHRALVRDIKYYKTRSSISPWKIHWVTYSICIWICAETVWIVRVWKFW